MTHAINPSVQEPLVYVVVLAWNHQDDTVECLASLQNMTYPNTRLVVADNGSTDRTTEIVRDRFPSVEIVHSETNLGVAGGYNLGIEYALEHQADYVLITNNDVIMDAQMLSEMVAVAEANDSAGVIMPKIYYYNRRDVIWSIGGRLRTFPPMVKMLGGEQKDGPQYSQVQKIEGAPSCTLLLKREAVEKAGMFDPKYFFYFDDWDFTERIRKSGYHVLFAPKAKMWHKVGASTQKSDKPARWWFIYGQSHVRFYLAHRTPTILLASILWFVFREIVKLKLNRLIPYLSGVCNGWADHRGWIPELRS